MVRPTLAVAKRSKFDFEYDEGKLQRRVTEDTELSGIFPILLEEFDRFKFEWARDGDTNKDISINLDMSFDLDEEQINKFIAYALIQKGEGEIDGFGTYITRFVRKLYENGCRKIELDLGNSFLARVLDRLVADGLEIELKGRTYIGCGFKSKGISVYCASFGEGCGTKSDGSSFFGQIFGVRAGFYSKNSTYVGDTFGTIMIGQGSERCTYKTPNPETLEQLLYQIPEDKGNSVVLITPTGEEIERYSL
jgi:hypothetical protein